MIDYKEIFKHFLENYPYYCQFNGDLYLLLNKETNQLFFATESKKELFSFVYGYVIRDRELQNETHK